MSSISRLGATALVAATLAVLPAAAASAHVRVVPEQTTAGGWTVLTFRVPNESETAATSQVTVDLPTDTPLLSVSTKPVPGWTATVETAPLPEPVDFSGTRLTEAPSRVVRTAQAGAEIADGQFQEFEVSAGPLPDAGTRLVLPAHQTYTDGTVVDWADVAEEGAEEPAHPAPELTTTEASDDGHGGADESSDEAVDQVGVADVEDAATVTASAPTTAEPDTLARLLGAAGLALGVVALVVAVLGRRRRSDA
ncbi:YcnI family copper-binding membrane protein [Cellulomonas xylanilytica]|nr:YcnI family protein [Cellulomonas xylanilytica]